LTGDRDEAAASFAAKRTERPDGATNPRSWGAVGAAGALLLALAGWLLFAGDGPPSAHAPRADRGQTTPPAGVEPTLASGVAGEGARTHLPAEAPAAERAEAETPRERVSIHGSVRVPGYGSLASGTLWVRGHTADSGSDEKTILRHALATDGTFEVVFDYAGHPQGWGLDVIASVPGVARMTAHVEAHPGDRLRVDLEPEGGAMVAGLVVDPSGRPLEGLPLALAVAGNTHWRVEWTDEGERVHALVAHVVTDRSGRFSVGGLEEGVHYDPLSLDPLWHLSAGQGLSAGEREPVPVPRVVASPGLEIAGTVVDAENGRPLQSVRWWVEVEGGNSHAWNGGPPRFSFRSPAPGGGARDVVVSVEFSAEGYRDFRDTLRLGPQDARVRRLDVRLVPLAPHEVGVLRVATGLLREDGRPVWVNAWREVVRGRNTSGVIPPLAREPDGTLLLRLPAGRSTLVFQVGEPLGDLMRWKGEVEAPGGRETPFEVPWPAHGSVRISLPESDGPTSVAVTLRRTDGSAGGGSYSNTHWTKPHLFVPAVPVGDWSLERFVPRQPFTLRVPFRVSAGETTTVSYPE
jgi:hypothetical protein